MFFISVTNCDSSIFSLYEGSLLQKCSFLLFGSRLTLLKASRILDVYGVCVGDTWNEVSYRRKWCLEHDEGWCDIHLIS